MRQESSRNFILITLAVVALATGVPRQHSPRATMSGWFFRASYPERNVAHHLFGDLNAVVEIFHIDLTAGGKTEELVAGAVKPNFFQMIGVEPVLGRAFRKGEDSGDHVVILSYRLWQRRFGRATSAVGRSITLEGEPYRVIGILPADFTWNDGEADIWMPCASKSGTGAAGYISQARLGSWRHGLECKPEI